MSVPHPRLAAVADLGVVAVLRAPSPTAAHVAVDALVRGGIRGIEVTYSTPDAAAVIAEVLRRHGDAVVVGAGTIVRPDQAREAADAGAAFLVSPGTVPAVADAMVATGAISMTGALTPTEVMVAVDARVDVVKLFPASSLEPSFLRALRGPFPDVAWMPTGGVTPTNLGAWLDAGAFAVGAGGDLLPSSALAGDVDAAEIERRARAFRAALDAHRASAG